MKNTAIVEKIEQSHVVVSTVRKGACGDNCAMCNSCTAQKVYTKAFCDFKVDIGDSVIIQSNTLSVIGAMFFVFVLPIILPLVLYLALSGLGTAISVLGICGGIVLSCLIICFISRSEAYLKKITPKITAIKNKK